MISGLFLLLLPEALEGDDVFLCGFAGAVAAEGFGFDGFDFLGGGPGGEPEGFVFGQEAEGVGGVGIRIQGAFTDFPGVGQVRPGEFGVEFFFEFEEFLGIGFLLDVLPGGDAQVGAVDDLDGFSAGFKEIFNIKPKNFTDAYKVLNEYSSLPSSQKSIKNRYYLGRN